MWQILVLPLTALTIGLCGVVRSDTDIITGATATEQSLLRGNQIAHKSNRLTNANQLQSRAVLSRGNLRSTQPGLLRNDPLDAQYAPHDETTVLGNFPSSEHSFISDQMPLREMNDDNSLDFSMIEMGNQQGQQRMSVNSHISSHRPSIADIMSEHQVINGQQQLPINTRARYDDDSLPQGQQLSIENHDRMAHRMLAVNGRSQLTNSLQSNARILRSQNVDPNARNRASLISQQITQGANNDDTWSQFDNSLSATHAGNARDSHLALRRTNPERREFINTLSSVSANGDDGSLLEPVEVPGLSRYQEQSFDFSNINRDLSTLPRVSENQMFQGQFISSDDGSSFDRPLNENFGILQRSMQSRHDRHIASNSALGVRGIDDDSPFSSSSLIRRVGSSPTTYNEQLMELQRLKHRNNHIRNALESGFAGRDDDIHFSANSLPGRINRDSNIRRGMREEHSIARQFDEQPFGGSAISGVRRMSSVIRGMPNRIDDDFSSSALRLHGSRRLTVRRMQRPSARVSFVRRMQRPVRRLQRPSARVSFIRRPTQYQEMTLRSTIDEPLFIRRRSSNILNRRQEPYTLLRQDPRRIRKLLI